jgi:hypothetical protein
MNRVSTRWRNRLGEERLEALLQESLAVATPTGAMKPSDLDRGAREARQPRRSARVKLRQSYKRVGKRALIMTSAIPMPASSSGSTARCASSNDSIEVGLDATVREVSPCRVVSLIEAETTQRKAQPHMTRIVPGWSRSSPACSPWRDACSRRNAAKAAPNSTAARPRGRMHRQGQAAQALRVGRQGQRRHHSSAARRRRGIARCKLRELSRHRGGRLARQLFSEPVS